MGPSVMARLPGACGEERARAALDPCFRQTSILLKEGGAWRQTEIGPGRINPALALHAAAGRKRRGERRHGDAAEAKLGRHRGAGLRRVDAEPRERAA